MPESCDLNSLLFRRFSRGGSRISNLGGGGGGGVQVTVKYYTLAYLQRFSPLFRVGGTPKRQGGGRERKTHTVPAPGCQPCHNPSGLVWFSLRKPALLCCGLSANHLQFYKVSVIIAQIISRWTKNMEVKIYIRLILCLSARQV